MRLLWLHQGQWRPAKHEQMLYVTGARSAGEEEGLGVNSALFLTHQQPLGDSSSPLFFKLCARQCRNGHKGKPPTHCLIAPTISNLCSCSNHFTETHSEQARSKPAHAVLPQLTGEHLAVVECKPPAYAEERVAGGLPLWAKWASSSILPSPLMAIRSPTSEDPSRAMPRIQSWF